MNEIILNIYLIINDGFVVEFRAVAYEREGGDDRKIEFLKSKAVEDYNKSYRFDAPSDKSGRHMPYNKFAKLEARGKQFELFEEIFGNFGVPENPLICVTPVVDGKILSN
ncbi:MAG: hypothetical protein A2057_11230 [Ignavibacteria bacterium GWA2_35_9]|nr:MAG: hypothetical protein A2057_11230 [Ignavibacteria bacterium GWA2_35_9]OGU50641.1 MAG: hypothetical protein A2080_15085 [Ignavibacteria bacterium GWC2_36_12]OGV02604.1 MAG: hypothetical protein A2330_11015 [Ignavibacteria bacterium RIFOXYB2_FULL_36_7]OGV26313.1 MAG: hypothetical protein A3J84_07875 [Ignavibacteria bacterium RIFOXYA2_FULL_37_17]